MRNWDNKTVKADYFDRPTGSRIRKEFSPKEIVKNPIGHEIETLTFASMKIMSELIDIQEQVDTRLEAITNKMKNPGLDAQNNLGATL